MKEERWQTINQLLALANAEGFDEPEITARKIERWRKSRLLPAPRRISLGRPLGTRSEYPPETGRQLIAICRLRRRFPHDLDAIRFGLWYEGYMLPLEDVKRSMELLLSPLMRALPLEDADPLEAAEQLVSLERSKPQRSGRRGRLKHLKSADETDTVRIAVLQLAFGDVPGFTAHTEEELGERSLIQTYLEALGLDRAQIDRVGETKPWLPQDNSEIGQQLEDMAEKQLLSLPALLQDLREANAKQLAQARADLKRMLGLKLVAKTMEALLGPNAFGFGLLSKIPSEPTFHTLFLLFLMRLRRTSYSVGINEIGATLQKVKPTYQYLLTFLRTLRQEYPVIAEDILTQTSKLDLSNPHAFEQLHTIFATAHTNHPEEFQIFFRKHPELAPRNENI